MKRTRVLATAAAVLATGAFTAPAHACDVTLFSGRRGPGDTYLIARATSDTAAVQRSGGLAGFGQVVAVENVLAPQSTQSISQPGRAVLVPALRDERCQPVPWTRSARWIQTNRRALFVGRIRPRASWVGTMPTYDVDYADQQPYVGGPADGNETRLTAEQLLQFVAAWPILAADSAEPAGARQPMWAWAAAHPVLARRDPARSVLTELCREFETRALDNVRLPLAGTYALTATGTGMESRTFYVRTRERPDELVRPREGTESMLRCREDPTAGYGWILAAALTPDALPSNMTARQNEGWLETSAQTTQSGGTRVWRAELDPQTALRLFAGNPVLSRLVADWEAGHQAGTLPGRFVVQPNGSVTFEQTLRLRDGRTITIHGARMSDIVAGR